MAKIIQQGAEAIISLESSRIVKDRIPKKYRHPELDNKLRRLRTKAEAKIINKLKNIIHVPKILEDPGAGRMIHMEYINGIRLSEGLEGLDWKSICKKIGQTISKLHEQDIIHGDLTTSNMILKDKEVYFIDFGLGFHSHKIEDKAVDLHLLKQALEAKHYKIAEEAINIIFENYKCKSRDEILEQLKKVESRGRYKDKD